MSLVSSLLAALASASEPSAQSVRFVEVEPGIRVEVVGWGGSGEAVLLLAGHGHTAHVFDEFAPYLTTGFRVFGLTRRGFGASAQPDHGYDLPTLVKDIAHVVEALHLQRVHLVGHSIAGDEMTRFARDHPNRVGKLIYLDAAYDRIEARQIEKTFPRLPRSHGPAPSDLASPAAVGAYVARTEILMPESEILATRVFAPDGRFLRPVTPDRILSAVAKMVEHPDYESINAPMLAIYAVPGTAAQLLPRYKTDDHETRLALEKIFGIWTQSARVQRDRFRRSVPRARVVEIDGASHYLFISHREKVLREVQAFLSAP